MRTYKVIDGNILDSDTDYIIHQVNRKGAMNSGVAKAIRYKYPKVFKEYREMYERCDNLLGKIQVVKISETSPMYCINMFTQDNFGYDNNRYTSLDAFKSALIQINKECKDCSVSFPWKVGCVRGGADWNEILPLICETLTDVKEIVFYRLDLG